jgi:hypothetical protein
VHIGLPKTATTTLQKDFFPKLKKYNIDYIGVNHPRETRQTTLYKKFYKAINVLFDPAFKEEITDLLQKSEKTLIFSEEMITVSDLNYSWKDKLINLEKIISGTDFIVLVTVREPVQVMFSYYSELYFRFKDNDFFNTALNNDDMEIYHYNKFFPFLFQLFDEKNVVVLSFEDIICGDFSVFMRELGINIIDDEIQLNNNNSKIKMSEYVIVEKNNNVLDYIAFCFKKIGIFNFVHLLILTFKLKKIMSKLQLLKFKKKYKVKIPDQATTVVLKKRMVKSYDYLRNEFNIKYH